MELKHIVIAIVGIAIAVIVGFAWAEINQAIIAQDSFIVQAISDMLSAVADKAVAMVQ